jgi:long-chain acyl-CoA synthetase
MNPDIKTLGQLFAWRVTQSPAQEAYREYDAGAKRWLSLTWQQIGARVQDWRAALATLALPLGERVAILLPNGLNTVCIDQASLALGLVPVPMHAIDNPDSIAYIIEDSDARLLVLTTRAQWDNIVATGHAMPQLRQVVLTEDSGSTPQPPSQHAAEVLTLPQWLARAPAGRSGAAVLALPDDALAAIVYTSGTTGKPKGVMLTHDNVLSNVSAVMQRVTVTTSDIFLSFLPLSHTFERTIGYYLPIAAGSCVAYARSVALIADDLKIVRPTVLVSVPRIYERFYAGLQESLEQAGEFSRSVFTLAQTVGWRNFCRAQQMPIEGSAWRWIDELLAALLHALTAQKVQALFGGRLRVAVCGGAPMSQAVAQCFLGLGVPLLQGYGLTETSPVVSSNIIADNWPQSVGRVVAGVEVRLGELNELQVRGKGVMRGYWKRPDDTAAAFTPDGWFRTGDQGALDDGRIRIVGRIKEIIVTSTGEKIAPADLELAITAEPLFEQAFVLGENRPFIAAIVVLNRHLWQQLATESGLDSAALDADSARQVILQRIQHATRGFPKYAVPRAVRLSLTPWSIQNGLMTPTLKLKRKALMAYYSAAVEEIYRKTPK